MDLYVASFDGAPPRRVNSEGDLYGEVQAFAWAPGGGRLAYLASAGGVGVSELFAADASGSAAAARVNDQLAMLGSVREFAWVAPGFRSSPSGWSFDVKPPPPAREQPGTAPAPQLPLAPTQ